MDSCTYHFISNSLLVHKKPLEYEYRYIWDNPVEQTGSQISASRRLGSGEGGVVYDVACSKDSLFSCGDDGVVCEWR